MEKREASVSRRTNERIIQNKDALMYEEIVADIKRLYPLKMKSHYRKQEKESSELADRTLDPM